jgi:transcriptional regulator GlxA family with amidase domain
MTIRFNVREHAMGYTHLGDPEAEAADGAGNTRQRETRDIGVVVFDGFSLLAAGVIPEVFEMANEIHAPRSKGRPLYDVRFYSAEGGSVAWSSAVSVWTYACDPKAARAFDALFIAGGDGARRAARDTLVIDWLRAVSPRTDVIKAIGEGRMLLDAAHVEETKDGFDQGVQVKPYVSHSNEMAYHTDDRNEPAKTALALVERDLGSEAAREIAARLASNGVAEPIAHVPDGRGATSAERVRASARWLKQNCERAISVSDAVRVAAMSERNYLRCFKQEIGVTPSEYLLHVRLERTSQLLTETDLPIGTIARRCGWGNGDRLAKIFRKRMATTPSEYRIRARSQAPDNET